MRKPVRLQLLLTVAAFVAFSYANAQNVGISVNGVAPDPAAILDINAVTLTPQRGLLVPRMTEAERMAITMNAATDDALLVYQTDMGTPHDSTNGRGFWYFDGPESQWKHLSVVRRGWLLAGNTLLGSGSAEYLGTTNSTHNNNLVFRTQLTPAPAMQMGHAVMNFESGFVGLGTAAAATERLEVEGAMRVGQTSNLAAASIVEGTIRYGTVDGAAPNNNNPKYHWGTTRSNTGAKQWDRLENAESRIFEKPYDKDILSCAPGIAEPNGTAMRGQLSAIPETQTTANPANIYSPFATNYNPSMRGNYKVQYLYRNAELVAAGLCFPAVINEVSFFSLDQEKLDNPAVPNPFATIIQGEIRGGIPSGASGLNTPSSYFGPDNTAPYMADNIRVSAIRNTFTLTPSPGWITFTLSPAITLGLNDNLIIEVVWSRNTAVGLGPKVELEDPGYTCTKWVLHQTPGGDNAGNRGALNDNPLTTGAQINGAPVQAGLNPHNKRPVTRFTGKVAGHTTVATNANYINYGGSIMVGDATWEAAAIKRGRGTVMAQNGIYDGNVLLSDHVFDRYFDGVVRPEDGQAAVGYAYVGLAALRERLERDRHLPNMPSRSEWEAKGGASLGTITTGLWQSVEDQALYISQLEQDLDALEEMTFGDQVDAKEAQRLITGIQASKRLTEAQKLHLIDALNAKLKPAPAKP